LFLNGFEEEYFGKLSLYFTLKVGPTDISLKQKIDEALKNINFVESKE
jgi:hypothetical protein